MSRPCDEQVAKLVRPPVRNWQIKRTNMSTNKLVIYNSRQLDVVISDIRAEFDKNKSIQIEYGKPHKNKTQAQLGFIFGALISNIVSYLNECGINATADSVRGDLYSKLETSCPELVVDGGIFARGKQRIKHLSEMDKKEASIFIDYVFHEVENNPIFQGMCLPPDIANNWVQHISPEDIKNAQTSTLPEKDEDYLRWQRTQPCLICGRKSPVEVHHIRDPRFSGISKKSPDWYSIPLCGLGVPDGGCHHALAHTTGNDGIDEALPWIVKNVSILDYCRLRYIKWKLHK